jgi:hypothetical protein
MSTYRRISSCEPMFFPFRSGLLTSLSAVFKKRDAVYYNSLYGAVLTSHYVSSASSVPLPTSDHYRDERMLCPEDLRQ